MYYVMSYNGKTNARAGHKNCTVVAREGERKGIGNVFLLLYDFTILVLNRFVRARSRRIKIGTEISLSMMKS